VEPPPTPPQDGRARADNNTLAINNYDEGGGFFALPVGTAETTYRAVQDNVNATATLPVAPPGDSGQYDRLYFSTTNDSPSLADISFGTCGETSGATILYNAAPGSLNSGVYACFGDLGLVPEDDIDGLIVLDVVDPAVFGPGDRVVFSLAPGSPSLTIIIDASTSGAAADAFIVEFGGAPEVLTWAAQMGMGASGDNIDALELLPCADGEECARDHGVRKSYIPTVSNWGLAILALLVLAAGAAVLRRRRVAVARVTR
jgi:hypothetical protein